MPSLGFVVSNGEIKVSQESRESPLPRGHQHRVTGAAPAGVARVKATKSSPTSLTVPEHQTGLRQDSNPTDLVHVALSISPMRRGSSPSSHTQQLSSAIPPGGGEAEPGGGLAVPGSK